MPDPEEVSQEDGSSGMASLVVEVDEQILGYTAIEFTGHALARMEQREVTQEEVLRTLRVNKQVPGKQPPGKTRVFWHKNSSLTIHVVYERYERSLGIITVIAKERSVRRR